MVIDVLLAAKAPRSDFYPPGHHWLPRSDWIENISSATSAELMVDACSMYPAHQSTNAATILILNEDFALMQFEATGSKVQASFIGRDSVRDG